MGLDDIRLPLTGKIPVASTGEDLRGTARVVLSCGVHLSEPSSVAEGINTARASRRFNAGKIKVSLRLSRHQHSAYLYLDWDAFGG